MIDLLVERLTRTQIERLFYEAEIPNHMLHGDSKEALLLNVARDLEDSQNFEQLLLLAKVAMQRLRPDDAEILRKALQRDGFVGIEGDVIPDEPLAEEHKSALQELVKRHGGKLNASILLHHLQEAEELFRLEKWDASVGQSRNFVEQLLSDIAKHAAKARGEYPDLSRPIQIREYLQTTGFFDPGERKKLVDGVYGFFSEEGSHPGIGRQSTARICLSILWNFGFYLMEKVDSS